MKPPVDAIEHLVDFLDLGVLVAHLPGGCPQDCPAVDLAAAAQEADPDLSGRHRARLVDGRLHLVEQVGHKAHHHEETPDA